jgi:MarR family transcriptional regulator, organic hydroperoxide resistance regulator
VSVQAGSRTEVMEVVGRSFKGAMAALRRLRGRETQSPGELTYAQYGLLFGLWDGTERPSRELALLADISPASAAEMLDGLAAAGLVDRTRSEEDKRIVLNSLTERGRELIEERRRMYEPRWRAALEEFTEEELLSAARVLDAIRAMFDERDAGERG